jgi:hypothetical protein
MKTGIESLRNHHAMAWRWRNSGSYLKADLENQRGENVKTQ